MSQQLTREQQIWRWKILFATYFGYIGYYFTRKVYSSCKKPIMESFGWDTSDIAHPWTVYLIAYMIGQFANSYFGPRLGPRKVLLWGLGVSIFCSLIFASTSSYLVFMLFMAVNGFVQATGWSGVVGAVSRWLHSEERGSIMGVWSTNYLFGNISVKLIAGALLVPSTSILIYLIPSFARPYAASLYHFMPGWRWAFLGCALLASLIWLLLFFWQRTKPEDVGLPPILNEKDASADVTIASDEPAITFAQYKKIAFNPIVLIMGASYFCIKFLRYALDSWLPTFLAYQGLDAGRASSYSSVFDWAGFPGVILAGIALDRLFRGNWPALCFTMAFGVILGYCALINFSSSLGLILVFVSIIGFMLYGPDTILCGAASVSIGGKTNAQAVAAIVNGIGSIGPILQEEVIGWLLKDGKVAGMHNTNILGLSMSILLALCMLVAMLWYFKASRQNQSAKE